jgi:hypothetical protein
MNPHKQAIIFNKPLRPYSGTGQESKKKNKKKEKKKEERK